MIAILITIAVGILAASAAVQMAKRKGRNPIAWGSFTFLFPPFLLVLLCFSGKPKTAVTPAVAKCSACGGAVSVQAAACPHCGQPQSQIDVRPWYGIPVEVAGTAAVLAAVAWSVWFLSQTTTWSLSPTGSLTG